MSRAFASQIDTQFKTGNSLVKRMYAGFNVIHQHLDTAVLCTPVNCTYKNHLMEDRHGEWNLTVSSTIFTQHSHYRNTEMNQIMLALDSLQGTQQFAREPAQRRRRRPTSLSQPPDAFRGSPPPGHLLFVLVASGNDVSPRSPAQRGREREVALPEQQDSPHGRHARSPPGARRSLMTSRRLLVTSSRTAPGRSGAPAVGPPAAPRRRPGSPLLLCAGFSARARPGPLRASPVLGQQPLPLRDPPRRAQGSLMHATGCGELWMVWDTTSKLHQYGCTCTTNENDYSTKTIMGNWNEERYDIQRIVQLKPLPSQDLKQNLLVSRPPP
ncbi:cilia- and flagella-associated protein 68 [Strix uralensis]|uniref:cilia- and flagella-associated protein 68 n=1 Tax=Strix uralensis TaxID=36305 RepID=UPI003DA79BF7